MITTADIVLNSKSEFHQAPIIQVVPTNSLQEEQEEGSRSSTMAKGGGRGLVTGQGQDFRARLGE